MRAIDGINISNVRYIPRPRAETESGLLGFVSFVLNSLVRVDGVAVRRTADGRLTLSFPAKKDSQGSLHYYFRPLNDEVRREVEFQVIEFIRLDEDA